MDYRGKRGRRAAGIVSTPHVIQQGLKYTVLWGVKVRGIEIRASSSFSLWFPWRSLRCRRCGSELFLARQDTNRFLAVCWCFNAKQLNVFSPAPIITPDPVINATLVINHFLQL